MTSKFFITFFFLIYCNLSNAYGLDEEIINGIIEGELEILDRQNFSEERELFDNLVLFFSKK